MSPSRKNSAPKKRVSKEKVINPFLPASSAIKGYIDHDDLRFVCMENHPMKPYGCKTHILNKKGSIVNHKHKVHHDPNKETAYKKLKAPKNGGISCKRCGKSTVSNLHSLIQHYRSEPGNHGGLGTQLELFYEYPELTDLVKDPVFAEYCKENDFPIA